MNPKEHPEDVEKTGGHRPEEPTSPTCRMGTILPISLDVLDEDHDIQVQVENGKVQLNWSQIANHPLPITKRNITESPLLKLPAEIRNMIWNYVADDLPVKLWH